MPQTHTSSEMLKKLDSLYEFDREPVPKDKLCSGSYFAGLFAGEHVAATEFVIGVLFVSWGARTFDVIVGLLLGNLMAVLSWTLICAPIATQTRLTLYWYLRKIGGPVVSFIYNILNAIMYCILAGCMITVSASAIRIPFKISAQIGWFPTSIGFVIIVLLVGAVVTALAILGFKSLSRFAGVCSPWMFLMFVAGAIVMLPQLCQVTGIGEIKGFSQFWQVAEKAIWIGKTPDGGTPKVGFWHVAAFAWFCNLAMHVGLADMALFRFAKKSWYGLYSAFGMFLGHYLAWITAGIMGAGVAALLKKPLTELDSGAVAIEPLGLAGAIAVVAAGWTTANPTLYRAGLAFQAVTPNWARWKVTLVTGIATTILACSPFVFTELLNFVAYYGLLLMPVGAIIVTEHWIFPKIGLTRCWAEHKKLPLNKPALISWALALGIATFLCRVVGIHLFFLFIPTWIITVLSYVTLSSIAGAKDKFYEEPVSQTIPHPDQPSKPNPEIPITTWLMGALALVSLIACVIMPVYVFLSKPEIYETNLATFRKWIMLPTIIYFVTGTAWAVMRDKQKAQSAK